MSRGRQKVSFEGLMQENVLGTFKIIRGFADLRDLAEVSVAMPYQTSKTGPDSGYQRQLNEQHVEDLKRFLSRGRYRFFPEIVLSLRSKGADDSVVTYAKRRAAKADKAFWVSVNLKALRADGFTRIHRIDGNHRLEAAKRLFEEQRRSATFKDFGTAPFCFVVLNSDRPEDDELAEAMLFNLINSKALSIASEHSLSVLMRDDGAPSDRFIEDPQVYLTRWIKDKIKDWPQGFYTAMGDTPLSRLHSAAAVLLRPGGLSKTTANEMETEAGKMFGPLYELAVHLRDQHEKFVHSYAFLPIAAEVYSRHSTVDAAKGANTEQERIRRAARWLHDFARWFDRIGGAELPLPTDPSILWFVFKRDFDKRAGQVFIAMSFRESKTLAAVQKAFEEAIDEFNKTHPNAPLEPKRIDKQMGESFEIPTRVFQEIDGSQLVIADLTDEKPNVYCEVGYAKARGIPFILTFRKKAVEPGKTPIATTAASKVHFDLSPYRHIEYVETHDLRDQLKKELDAWHDHA
jgi:nucleoside 2-deoxyribosyltransferase